MLFDDANFKGRNLPLNPGDYSSLGSFNDKTESVKIQSGYTVILYEKFNFQGKSITRATSDLNLGGDNFDDNASSAKVFSSAPPSTPPANGTPTNGAPTNGKTSPGTTRTTGSWTTIENPLGYDTFEEILGAVSKFLFQIGMALAPVMLIIAGFMFVMAGGSPEKVTNAKTMIRYTIIGLVVILLASGLVAVLKSIIGVTS